MKDENAKMYAVWTAWLNSIVEKEKGSHYDDVRGMAALQTPSAVPGLPDRAVASDESLLAVAGGVVPQENAAAEASTGTRTARPGTRSRKKRYGMDDGLRQLNGLFDD